MTEILLELDAMLHHLSRAWQIATLGVVVCVGTLVGYVLVEAFASLMLALRRRRVRTALTAPVPAKAYTYCRACHAYTSTAYRRCLVCEVPLVVFRDEWDMQIHMQATFPLTPPAAPSSGLMNRDENRRSLRRGGATAVPLRRAK